MYTHPTYTARASGLYKVTVDGTGHVSAATAVTKADITALGIPGSDTKYGVFKAATADAAGGTGLVPAPAKGAQGLFLRGDNVWAKPTDTTYNDATTSAHGLMTAADKTKLDGIASGANKYTHPASHSIDMITETTDKKVMTAAERTKLAGIAAGANKYTHPNYAARTSGLYKVTVDDTGHISAVAAVTKADITGLGIPSSNTWRGIQNNLTSTATDQSLSAAQGKWLNENKATMTTLTNENLDKVTTPGFYNAGGGNSVTNKPSSVDNFGMIVVHSASGDYYTQIVYAADKSYRRVCSNGTWKNWSQDILTDTKYTHPTYTAKASGLYKITVDGTGHVSAATAVTKSDITALGIPGQDTNTTYSTGTTSYSGTTKLYTGTGSATDGTMTQKAITDGLNSKSGTGHTHNYAGSSSAGGVANSAAKLSIARTVSGGTDITMSYSYDGSANSNASIGYYNSSAYNGNTNNYPFHRFAKLDAITSSYTDKTMTVLLTQDFNGGAFGIARISLRTNNVSNKDISSAEVKWLVRSGFNDDAIQVAIYNVAGATYADAFLKLSGTYAGTVIRAIANGARGNISRTWTLVNSKEADNTTSSDSKTSTECYANIAAAGTKLHNQSYSVTVSGSDSGTTSYANSTGSASKAIQDSAGQQINKTYIKNLSISGKTITYTKGDGTTGTIVTQDTNTTYNDATTSAHGLMTAADKVKLNGIATNANNYTHPTSSGNKHIPSGGSSGKVLRWSADGTAVWGDVPSDAISITRVEYNKLLANNTYDPNKYYYVTDDFDSATIINDSISSTSTAYSSSKTNALLGAKVNKSSKVSATMNASSWSGSSAPYTITLSINGVTTSNNVEILIPGSATNAQVEAWMAAGIVNGTQAANSVTLKAYGDKPSINIPIEAIVRND